MKRYYHISQIECKSKRKYETPQKQKIHAPLIANSKQIYYHKWHNSCFRDFFILEYRKVIRSSNNGPKGIQQTWQF